MSSSEKKNLQLVKVYVRQRPFTQDEIEHRLPNVVKSTSSTDLMLKSGATEKKYTFDRVFRPSCTQTEVYDVVVSPLINLVLTGYTCTVFAYGQTGTGKTHTMIGEVIAPNIDFAKDPTVGMVPRAAIHIFDELSKLKITHSVRVSFVEIYNEEVRDLLVSEGVPLRIYDDPDNKGATCIKGLTETYAKNTTEVYDLLNVGTIERQTAATNLNRVSSRSHTLFTLVVNTREISEEGEEVIKTGKLHLIDLAGSENIGRSGATEMRAREAGSINKSLLTLGKVIKALALKLQHVPYRESKLTRILQDSLGGKSQTCMIATFAPGMDCFDETVSTLDYAYVARSVANCPTVNINKCQTHAFKASQYEVKRLRQELSAARAGEGFYMHTDSYKKINQDIETKGDRISNLIQQIEHLERHISSKKSEYDRLQESFQDTSSTAESIAKRLEEQNRIIKENQYVEESMNGQVAELNNTAQTLLNVAETSTRLEGVYYKKYEDQCDSTIDNATLIGQINNNFFASLREIGRSADKLSKEVATQVEGCANNLDILQKTRESALQEVTTLADALRSASETQKSTLDNILKEGPCSTTDFQSNLNAILDEGGRVLGHHIEEYQTMVEEVEDYALGKVAQFQAAAKNFNSVIEKEFSTFNNNVVTRNNLLQTLHERLENRQTQIQRRLHHVRRIKELRAQVLVELGERYKILEEELHNINHMQKIIDELIRESGKDSLLPLLNLRAAIVNYKEEVKPLAEEVQLFLQEKTDFVYGHREKYLQAIDSYESKSKDFFKTFSEAFEIQLKQHHQEKQASLNQLADKAAEIEESLLSVAEHIDDVKTRASTVISIDKSYESDMAQFAERSSEKMRHLQENLNSNIHVGDTPAKPAYQYPSAVEKGLSVSDLRMQIVSSDEEED